MSYPFDASQTKRKKTRSENVNQSYGSQDSAYGNSQALAQKRIKYDAKKVNQKICLTVDLHNCYVEGYTEIQMQDVSRRVFESREFKLNCRQLCVTSVTMNGTDCSFDMYNFQEQVVPDGEPDYSYGTFNDFYKAAQNASDDGELVILVPPNLNRKRPKDTLEDPNAPRKNELFIRIHYYIKNPKGGVRFVTPDSKAYPNRFTHMYTHNEMGEGARLWLPCVDTLTERCTYDLEITSHANMYVVASGDLKEQLLSDDGHWKTSYFRVDIPTTPYSLGFAIGPFDIYVHGYNFNANPLNAGSAPSPMFEEESSEGTNNVEKEKHSRTMTSFGLPGTFEELQYCCKFISQAYDFFEEYLACSFPYKSYKQVFVEEVYSTIDTTSTVAFLSTHLLHNSSVIEQTFKTRYELTYALAMQWFGHWISVRYWSDIWLVYGLAGYISDLFCRKLFGHNYYRYKLFKDCESICNSEPYYNTPLMLLSGAHAPTMVQLSDLLSNKVFKSKSRFVIYMIEKRIGSDALRKVLSSIVSGNSDSATSNNNNPTPTSTASNLNPISDNVDRNFYTKKFLKLIRRMTGHDLRSFADRWIYGVGTPSLTCGFFFNRKKHVIELALKQNRSLCGRMSGTLSIRVNELEGPYDHSVNFDDDLHAFEFPCHSRVRKVRKKRKLKKGDKDKEDDTLVNIAKEDEDDPNDPKKTDTPILWIRIDPELEFLRQVSFPQGEVMLINMLELENDVVGQCEAIEGLLNHITSYKAVEALNRVLCNPQMYYKIRIRAAKAMAKSPTIGLDLLLKFFRSEYYDSSGNQIRANNFDNISSYLVQKGVVKAIASVKDKEGRTSTEAAEFLLDLLKNNDNSRNPYTDNYYIVTILQSLTQMEAPSIQGKIIKQIERHLSIEKLVPSYHNVITVACLKCLAELMKQNKVNVDMDLFKDYIVYGHYEKVRTAASKYLLDLAAAFSTTHKGREIFDCFMDIVDRDKVTHIKRKILQFMIQMPNPVYPNNTNYYNTYMPPSVVQRMDQFRRFFRDITEAPTTPERLWTLMNTGATAFDGMVRSMAARLFFKLYLMDVPRAWEHKPRSHKIIVKRQPGPAPYSKRVAAPPSVATKRKAPDITVSDLSPVSTPVTPSSISEPMSPMNVDWENAMSPPPPTSTVVDLPPPLPVSPRDIKMEDVTPPPQHHPTPPPPLPTPPPATTTTLTPVGSTKIVLKMKSLEQIREFNVPLSPAPPPLTPSAMSPPPPITSLPPPLTSIVPLPEAIPPPAPPAQPPVSEAPAPKEKKHRDKEHKKHKDKKERKEKKEKKEKKRERRAAREAAAASASNTPQPSSPVPAPEPPKLEIKPEPHSLHVTEIPVLPDIKPPVVELPPALPVPSDISSPPPVAAPPAPAPVPVVVPAPSPVSPSVPSSGAHDKYKTVATGANKIKITLGGKKSASLESMPVTPVTPVVIPPPLPEAVETPPSTPSTPSQVKTEGTDSKKLKKVRIRIQDHSVAERDLSQ